MGGDEEAEEEACLRKSFDCSSARCRSRSLGEERVQQGGPAVMDSAPLQPLGVLRSHIPCVRSRHQVRAARSALLVAVIMRKI